MQKKKKKKHARVSEFFPSEPVLKPVFAVVEVLFWTLGEYWGRYLVAPDNSAFQIFTLEFITVEKVQLRSRDEIIFGWGSPQQEQLF